MAEILVADSRDFADFAGMELLTNERRNRLGRMRSHEAKSNCLTAGLLLRYLLGEKVSQVVLGAHGKPSLPSQEIYFNLSHSGHFVVLAYDTEEVGIDVQKWITPSENLIKHCFTEEETAWLRKQDPIKGFCRLWTGKESVMKATGAGFSMSILSFSLFPPVDGSFDVKEDRYHLRWFPLDGGILCIASRCDGSCMLTHVGRNELLSGAK